MKTALSLTQAIHRSRSSVEIFRVVVPSEGDALDELRHMEGVTNVDYDRRGPHAELEVSGERYGKKFRIRLSSKSAPALPEAALGYSSKATIAARDQFLAAFEDYHAAMANAKAEHVVALAKATADVAKYRLEICEATDNLAAACGARAKALQAHLEQSKP